MAIWPSRRSSSYSQYPPCYSRFWAAFFFSRTSIGQNSFTGNSDCKRILKG